MVAGTNFSFDNWTKQFASAKIDNTTGQITTSIPDFIFASDKFYNDIKTNNGANAGKIYAGDVLELGRQEVERLDTDRNGLVSAEEYLADAKKDAEAAGIEFNKEAQTMALRSFLTIDMDQSDNGKHQLSAEEFAAIFAATDSQNTNSVANGKLSKDEYATSSMIMSGDFNTQEHINFRGRAKRYLNDLFGIKTY